MLKKLFCLLLLIPFLACATGAESFAQEFSQLYILKKTPKQNVTDFTDIYLIDNNYKIVKKDDYYLLPPGMNSPSDTYVIFIIQETGADCYFYTLTNNTDLNPQEEIIKSLKSGNIKAKKIKNKQAIDIFYNDAIELKNKTSNELLRKKSGKKKYDFSNEAQVKFDTGKNKYDSLKVSKTKVYSKNKTIEKAEAPIYMAPSASVSSETPKGNKNNPKMLKGSVVYIPEGTSFSATLQSAVSSGSLAKNDRITAVLASDWSYNGELIAPAGSILYGNATDTKAATFAYGNGKLGFSFNELITPKGFKIGLTSNNVVLKGQGVRALKIAANVLVGGVAGVAMGALYGAISGDVATALAIGAGVGAAGGMVFAASQKGEEAEIPEGSPLRVRLLKPMSTQSYTE